MSDNNYVTKADLKKELRAAVNEIAEMFADFMQAVAERFDQVDKRLDNLEERLNRMEDKLDRCIAITDLHAVDIRQLKRKTGLA